jgi:hypothetical protein
VPCFIFEYLKLQFFPDVGNEGFNRGQFVPTLWYVAPSAVENPDGGGARKGFPTVLLLVSLPGCYACTQHQQRRDAFFGKTNGEIESGC